MATKSNLKTFSLSLAFGLLSQLCLTGGAQAQSANQKDSLVFQFKPQQQSWVVPEGVSQIHINAYGAQGGSVNGGKGGLVKTDLTVKAGEKLYIHVGGQPAGADGGYNGGGKGCGKGTGGGGATDVRTGDGIDTRIIVAGGGGGTGYTGKAGAGGGLTGEDGKYDTLWAHLAYGGSQQAAGKGARAYFSKGGEGNVGGEGINSRGECTNGAMAGGGGGYYGGGAGGAGGGGGGSSYTSADNKNVVHVQGANEGNGKLVIYWEKPKK